MIKQAKSRQHNANGSCLFAYEFILHVSFVQLRWSS